MENEQDICPICGSKIIERVIDYSDWNAGHLLVVRAVPVRECQENGHRFFQGKVARSLEKLFQADRSGQFGRPLGAIAIMQVPVAEFALAT